MKIVVAFGTRPEAIKIAPIFLALQDCKEVTTTLINTGQHRELSTQALQAFGIRPDIDLDVMRPNQSLGQLTGRLFSTFDEVLAAEKPDWVVVQGDTSTAMVAAVSAFYRRINIAHVEAGLRSHDIWAPFPEEANRTFISQVATLNFSPTEGARVNLLQAGVRKNDILVTGNTVVDAIRLLRPGLQGVSLHGALGAAGHQDFVTLKPILVTSHRRESFGIGLETICEALLEISRRFQSHAIFYPVHPNPQVREMVQRKLASQPRIHLVEPLSYLELLAILERCELVLTDSGGIQEEAPSFDKPLLILRDVTERPEVLDVGAARIVGTEKLRIVENTAELLTDPAKYAEMANAKNPFGDGYAAQRIVRAMISRGPCG